MSPWLPKRRHLLPGPQTADVWWISIVSLRSSSSELFQCLSDEEKLRSARYLREEDRQRFLISRAGLRTVLGAYLDESAADVKFVTTEFGKPGLTSPVVEFNLSHSGDWAVVGIAKTSVGIDVEQILPIPDLDSLAEHYFSSTELKAFTTVGQGEKLEAFYRCWCRKEAFLKATGKGLISETDSFSVVGPSGHPVLLESRSGAFATNRWSFRDLNPSLDYAAAIVVDGPLQLIVERELSI